MIPLPVLVLVLGIGIVRYQSIGYWVLGVQLGIVLTLVWRIMENYQNCSVLYCVTQLCKIICTLILAVLRDELFCD